MKEPRYNLSTNTYYGGRFAYKIEDRSVLISKNVECGIESVGIFTYHTEERAEIAAYRMARMQENAGGIE